MRILLARFLMWLEDVIVYWLGTITRSIDPGGNRLTPIDSYDASLYNDIMGDKKDTDDLVSSTIVSRKVMFDVDGEQCEVGLEELELPESFGDIEANKSGGISLTEKQRDALGDAILKHVGNQYHMALLEEQADDNMPWPSVFCCTKALWGETGFYNGSAEEGAGCVVFYGVN